MWDKLLALFKDQPLTGEIQSAVPDVQPIQEFSPPANSSMKIEGPSTLIGHNYLKLEDEEEAPRRKFINLTKLLKGDYKDEQTKETTGKPKS